MNIEILKNSYTLWKDINTFPTFNELLNVAKKEKPNLNNPIIKIAFCTKSKELYEIMLEFNLFKECNTCSSVNIKSVILYSPNIVGTELFKYYSYVDYHKYNFSKHFKRDFLEYNSCPKKWCYMSDLINYITLAF